MTPIFELSCLIQTLSVKRRKRVQESTESRVALRSHDTLWWSPLRKRSAAEWRNDESAGQIDGW